MLQDLFQLAATKQEQLLTESGQPILAASRTNPMTSFKLHMTQIKQFPFQMQISGYVRIFTKSLPRPPIVSVGFGPPPHDVRLIFQGEFTGLSLARSAVRPSVVRCESHKPADKRLSH